MSTITNERTLPRIGGTQRWIWWLAGMLAGVLLLAAIGYALMLRAMANENTPPPDLDVSRTRLSAQEVYRASYTPTLDPITIDTLHSWTLQLETPDGLPVETAAITVHGDMPGHGHGLPTTPAVSALGNGAYLVEGLKFHMPGWWYVEFAIDAGGQHDTLRFDFVLR